MHKQLSILLLFVLAPLAVAQQDAPFLESPESVVEAMLKLGEVDADDVVYDLGSGDGRIVIAAARVGARGVGIEIDPELVALSIENAREAGVSDRAEFIEGDLFDAQLSDATVVMMYLLPNVNRKLKPIFLEQLASGTPVVSHRYRIDGWEPVERIKVEGRWIYLYRIP